MTPARACVTCGGLTAYRGAYYCAACQPQHRCLDCGAPIVGRSANARTCHPCAARRVTHRKGGRRRQTCAACGKAIVGRAAQAAYCVPCAAAKQRASETHCRRPWLVRDPEPPRDLTLEQRIDALVAHYRRTGKFTLTEEAIWSRTTDLVAEHAQDLSDIAIVSPQQRQWQATSRARRKGKVAA